MREADPLTENPLGPPLVLCVGEVLYDLFSDLPHAPTSDLSKWEKSPGGSPANVAAALAKLGTASAYIGNIGDDPVGEALVSILNNLNVNVDGVTKLKNRTTRQVFVERDASHERSFVDFSGQNADFADACALDLDKLPGVLFYAAQFLSTATLPLAFPGSSESLRELVGLAKMCKVRIVVDVNWRPVFWNGMASDEQARATILDFLKMADIVKISVEEVDFLFGETLAQTALDTPSEVMAKIGGSVSGIIVTAGAEGAAYNFELGMEAIEGKIAPVVPPEGVQDTTGAGDCFLAAFLSEMFNQGGPFALSNPEKIKRIGQFAATTASRVITAQGGITPLPSREQVEALLQPIER